MIDKVFDTAYSSNDDASSVNILRITVSRVLVFAIQLVVIALHFQLVRNYGKYMLADVFIKSSLICCMLLFFSSTIRVFIFKLISDAVDALSKLLFPLTEVTAKKTTR